MSAPEMRKLMESLITEESFSAQDVLEALQDLLDSTSLQAYPEHQLTAQTKAQKILDSFRVKSSMREEAPMKHDAFTDAYIEAALWSSTDNADVTGGDPLDKNYSSSDLSDETMKQMMDDCASFQSQAGDMLDVEVRSRYPSDQQAGHDFWLTRNGHGAGF